MSLPPPTTAAELAGAYVARYPARHGFRLRLEDVTLAVRSNSAAVVEDLRGYFGSFALAADSAPADLEFLLLDAPVEAPPVPLLIKPLVPGKRPDKERYADFPAENGGADKGGRLVRKQATGMLFLFGGGGNMAPNIAIGPCAANRNQLVNFLCARYMERRVAAGWMLGHAAGVVQPVSGGGKALALCGFAGLGKSTLALHLVARGLDFLSNDRVLVQPAATGSGPVLHGIPKHPRLNPGTALGNPALAPFLAPLMAQALPEAARLAYADLSPEALRQVEDKFDAPIDVCFGPGRFRLAAPLAGVVVLNWRHGGGASFARRVNLRERRDLLEALRKPPGLFYLPQSLATGARLSPEQCLDTLDGVPALELTGGVDFEAGALACEQFLGAKAPAIHKEGT